MILLVDQGLRGNMIGKQMTRRSGRDTQTDLSEWTHRVRKVACE